MFFLHKLYVLNAIYCILAAPPSKLGGGQLAPTLNKAVTLLFRNSAMQRCKGNVGCGLFQNTHIRDLQ